MLQNNPLFSYFGFEGHQTIPYIIFVLYKYCWSQFYRNSHCGNDQKYRCVSVVMNTNVSFTKYPTCVYRVRLKYWLQTDMSLNNGKQIQSYKLVYRLVRTVMNISNY